MSHQGYWVRMVLIFSNVLMDWRLKKTNFSMWWYEKGSQKATTTEKNRMAQSSYMRHVFRLCK